MPRRFPPSRYRQRPEPIALVGLSLRVPGADNPAAFWRNLCEGTDSVRDFSEAEVLAAGVPPEIARHPDYVKSYGVLDDIDCFDAEFFNISPREAALLDPQQRLFLECAYHALEDAGYDAEAFPGRIGVYAGCAMSTYLLRNLVPRQSLLFSAPGRIETMMANHKDLLPTQVSYRLNLTGPSLNISCACSTGLAAIHLACLSLRAGEVDMMLAGGAHIRVPQTEGYLYRKHLRFSPDGRCRAFDARAKGFVGASGVGVVVLKRLADALADRDQVYAVLLGSATGNDGAEKLSITTPSVQGLADTALRAMTAAGVASESIGLVEAHGAGTELGDPIEFAALCQAFRAAAVDSAGLRPGGCALGSVKPNIGYTQHASGAIGLIKAALALKHRQIPGQLHFETPHPKLDLPASPFRIGTAAAFWTDGATPRRAAVNCFGVGGSSAFAVLEEAPPTEASGPSRPWQVLPLSAKTQDALRQMAETLAGHLDQYPDLDLADVAYTLQCGRRAFGARRVVLCRNRQEASAGLRAIAKEHAPMEPAPTESRPLAFLFPGQGEEPLRAAQRAYAAEPSFRAAWHLCADAAKPLQLDLIAALRPETGTSIPESIALFAFQYALAGLWRSFGLKPISLLGQGIGQYAADSVSGRLDLDEAMALLILEQGAAPPQVQASTHASLAENLGPLLENPEQVFLELGPSAALTGWLANHPARAATQTARHGFLAPPPGADWLWTLGDLWQAGVAVDWTGYSRHERRQRVPLPGYPFARTRHWIDPPARDQAQAPVACLKQRTPLAAG